ncbi:MAG: hypothetical protein RBT19_04900 [Tenuifilaceae bacterium]|jgi:hypothetical protein|nr:hypothetical protein [Tenuifilaceae bacterium]
MLLKFFRKPLPGVLVSIVVLGVAAWLKSLFWGGETVADFSYYRMPLYALLQSIIPVGSIWGSLLTLGLVIIIGSLLIQLNTRYILIKNRTYLPSLFYIIICSGFISLQTLNPAVFAAFFAILTVNSLFASLAGNSLDRLFKAGFYTALGTLFYLPTIILFLLILFSIVILNVTSVRSWLAATLGFVTPLFFGWFFYYYFNDDVALTTIVLNTIADGVAFSFFDTGLTFVVWLSLALFMLLVTGGFVILGLPTQKINVRKYHSIFLIMILLVGTATIAVPFVSAETVFLFAIPFSYFLSSYFTFARGRIFPEILFVTLLVLVILMQFIPK